MFERNMIFILFALFLLSLVIALTGAWLTLVEHWKAKNVKQVARIDDHQWLDAPAPSAIEPFDEEYAELLASVLRQIESPCEE